MISPLPTKLVRSRWLHDDLVLLRYYGPRECLGPQTRKKKGTWPIPSLGILTEQASSTGRTNASDFAADWLQKKLNNIL